MHKKWTSVLSVLINPEQIQRNKISALHVCCPTQYVTVRIKKPNFSKYDTFNYQYQNKR